MTVWMVRAGSSGERETFALDNNVVVIGFDDVPDMNKIDSWDELKNIMREAGPGQKKGAISNWSGQVWAFAKSIEVHDLIVLPLKLESGIAIGEVVSGYKYVANNPEGAMHTLPVKWLSKAIPRSKFSQDLLYSFGAFMTVCRIQRNNAEERIRAVLKGKSSLVIPDLSDDSNISDETAMIDLEEIGRDAIEVHIRQEFKGHKFARLIASILKAQGYNTALSPPGADGGVDIMAGKGTLGFSSPRLCVQVKSGGGQQPITEIRALTGVMKEFGADQGLYVSMDGFKRSVVAERSKRFFQVRLWDLSDVIRALQDNYDSLPDDLKAELHLKRVWTLVPGE
ncbi:MAG: restriction endonuclease [Candidatus Marinimicrobia bacterium]|nr:restriction endonuclease [Candidatus Neomarinimicrobiota bacterium]